MLSASRILSSVPPRNPQPELAKPAEVLPITTGSHPVLQPAPSVQEVPKPIVPESVSQPQAPETEAQTSTPPAVLAGYSLVPHSKKHRVVANIPAGYIVVP